MRWSVLIPVFLGERADGSEILVRVLRAYEHVAADALELVICCDGPDPRVEEAVRQVAPPVPLQLLEQERAGQSAATNRAARAARGEWVLFSAQDIVPHPGLLREHERAQRRHPGQMVLGTIRYPAELTVTPFMEFLVQGGPQFAYDRFRDGAPIPPFCLYAPNFSVRREVFQELRGFREDLPYACQDSELGIRFAEAGGRIFYHAEAVGEHWHPQTLEGYLPRQRLAGRNTVRLLELHPRHRKLDWLREKVLECYLPVAARLAEYHAWVRRIEGEPGAWRVSVRHSPVGSYDQDALWFLYDRITKCHFYRGVHEALEERQPGWLQETFADWRVPGPEPLPEFHRTSSPMRFQQPRRAEVSSAAEGLA